MMIKLHKKRAGRNAKRFILVLTLLLATALTGCSSLTAIHEIETQSAYAPLPSPDAEIPPAPVGDVIEGEIHRASIYSLNADGTSLIPSTRVMWLTGEESIERRICEEALRTPTLPNGIAIAPKNSSLAFVESGMRTTTVSITPGGALTDTNACAHLASAMASTLLDLENADYVNILVAGQAISHLNLPIGAISSDGASLEKMLADASDESARLSTATGEEWRLTRNVTLYFPSDDGKYMIPETRRIQFSSPDYASHIVKALGEAPENKRMLSGIPLKEGSFSSISESILPNGERIYEIRFTKTTYNALQVSTIDDWQFIASVALSVTTFCPDADGITIYIGDDMVSETYDANGKKIVFPGGIIRRSDFAGRIAALVNVYFESHQGGLQAEQHAVSLKDSSSIRARIALLMEGPESYGLLRTLPRALNSSDILGTGVSQGVASINLSSEVYRLAQSMTCEEEAMFVYSIVNTLTDIDGINAVRIYIDSRTSDTLAGNIWLTGPLYPNPGLATD